MTNRLLILFQFFQNLLFTLIFLKFHLVHGKHFLCQVGVPSFDKLVNTTRAKLVRYKKAFSKYHTKKLKKHFTMMKLLADYNNMLHSGGTVMITSKAKILIESDRILVQVWGT